MAHIAVGTTLNTLKVLNLPYLQHLVDLALHIHDTVQTIRSNKRDAAELSERVGLLVCKIAERHSKDRSTSPEQQEDLNQFLETLREIDVFLQKLSKRNALQRYCYQHEDQGGLQLHKASLSEAKTDYLFSSMLVTQRDHQEEIYRVFRLEELEILHVVKFGPPRYDAAHIVQLGGNLKQVLVRRYTPENKLKFCSDIRFQANL